LFHDNASAHEPVERDTGQSSLVTSNRRGGPFLKKFYSFSKKVLKEESENQNVANRICVAADLKGEGRGYSQIAATHPAAHDGR
jgi:hypothetical protein